ncbi:hypothetical protein GOODEAATRI_025881, partial [Goodea atripinnis]
MTVCVMTQQSSADEQVFIEDFLKREYSLVKPYRGLGFSSSSQWDLMGTAMVTPDHVRLTPDMQSRQGAVWSRILKVHFKIHGIGKKNLNGDGLAIWLTKDRMQNVMLGNGTLSYDHDRDGRPTELGGCSAMTRNSIYDTFLLVRYSKNMLTVMVDVDGKQEWRECATISGLRLPTGYYFGASSATGDLS